MPPRRLSLRDAVDPASSWQPISIRVLGWMPDGRLVATRRPDSKGAGLHFFGTDGRHEPWDFQAMVGSKARMPDPSTFRLSPTGTEALLTRHAEGDRVSTPAGDLYRFDLATRVIERLTWTRKPQRRPRFSPDGRHIGFVRADEVHVMPRSGGVATAISRHSGPGRYAGRCGWVYEEELGQIEAWVWLQGSDGVAFLVQDESRVPVSPLLQYHGPRGRLFRARYPQPGDPNPRTHLVVCRLADRGANLEFLEAKTFDLCFPGSHEDGTYLLNLQATPDGRLTIMRMPRDQRSVEVLLVDPRSGDVQVVLHEDAVEGWLDPPAKLRFTGDSGFIWRSERCGRYHAYHCELATGALRKLTEGDWDVTSVVATNGEHAYILAGRPQPIHRTLWRVPLDSGEPVLIGPERGVSTAEFSPCTRWYVLGHSTLDQPPRFELRSSDGATNICIEDNRRLCEARSSWSAPKIVSVRLGDRTHFARISLPPAKKRHPVFTSNYGGPGSQDVLDQWPSLLERFLVQEGFAVFSLDNRGTASRGRAWRKAPYLRLGVVESEDQAAGARWLSNQDWCDPERVALFGWSYGGYMALTCAANHPDLWRCVVSVAPVVDWHLYDSIYTERFMALPSTNPDGYRQTSLLHRVEDLSAPILLVHGAGDDNVYVKHSMLLAEQLQAKGKRFSMMVYPHLRHGLEAAREHVWQTILDFVRRELALG